MKRRFRELLRAALPTQGLANHDHVLIGRAGGVERDFHLMGEELAKALGRPLELVSVPWEMLFEDLNAGQVDILMSGLTVTPVVFSM